MSDLQVGDQVQTGMDCVRHSFILSMQTICQEFWKDLSGVRSTQRAMLFHCNLSVTTSLSSWSVISGLIL